MAWHPHNAHPPEKAAKLRPDITATQPLSEAIKNEKPHITAMNAVQATMKKPDPLR
jgi:hypothetical protein